MNKERAKGITRREFFKVVGGGIVGLVAGKLLLDNQASSKAQGEPEHKVFLPFVSRPERPLDDLVRLFNEKREFSMRTNPAHPRADWEALLKKYQKKEILYHWLENENDVPLMGAPQRGYGIDGETGMKICTMMGFYSGDPQKKTVEFWVWLNPEYHQYVSKKTGRSLTEMYSGVHSFYLWRAVAAPDRGFLWGEFPEPTPTWEDIEKYFMNNPLILVAAKQ